MLINAVISTVSGIIAMYIGYKIAKKDLKNDLKKEFSSILLQLKDDSEAWLNSETGAKALYGVGMLVGAGVKQSLGITQKGGKMKFQDLLVQVGLNWAQQHFGIPGVPGQPNEPSIKQQETLNTRNNGTELRRA